MRAFTLRDMLKSCGPDRSLAVTQSSNRNTPFKSGFCGWHCGEPYISAQSQGIPISFNSENLLTFCVFRRFRRRLALIDDQQENIVGQDPCLVVIFVQPSEVHDLLFLSGYRESKASNRPRSKRSIFF